MNLWAIIPLASCLTFSILFILTIQQIKTRVDKAFALFLFTSGVWALVTFILDSTLTGSTRSFIFWNSLVMTAIPLVVVTYYHFIRAYDNKPAGIGAYLGYAMVLVLLVLALKGYLVKNAYFVNGFLYHDIKPWDYVLAAIVIPYLAAILYTLVRRYRRSKDGVDRNKTLYLMIGWSILLVINYIAPFSPKLSGYPIDQLGNLINALIILYTVSRFRLLDIRWVMRRGLAVALGIIPILGVYVGLILLALHYNPNLPLYITVLITSGLTMIIVFISWPLRRPMQALVDRFFFRDTYHHRQELISFTNKMGNILNLSQLATAMLEPLSKGLKIPHAVLLFEDASSGYYTTQFAFPESLDNVSDGFRLFFDSPIVQYLEKEPHVLMLSQIDAEPRFKALWENEKQALHDSQLELFCPLKSHGKLVGILGLSKKYSGKIFTQEDVDLVTTVASQAGVLVENAQLYSQAVTWSITDGLTKVYNHRHLHECLDNEIARSTRFGTTFSLAMIDIDFFKTYNDTYGHQAGDDVLASVAKCIQASIRNIDMAFRYGGEEFAVILPETQIEGAYVVAERIREKIEKKLFPGRSSVTASLGVAAWPADGMTKEQLISSADKALYSAKESGRNRVCALIDAEKQGFVPVETVSETQRIAISMIFALAATVDAKDHYTYGHSRKVSQYAVAMAHALNLPNEKISIIRTAGLLHDIGKIGVPDSILNKEGPLNEQEWRQIKQHPEMGVEILRYVAELANSLPIILNHHEHFDGTGYPLGLKGEKIPLEARLLAIADAFDAMTSLRPYHNQRSSEEAIEELRRCAGSHFDPEMVEIFCKAVQNLAPKSVQAQLPQIKTE